MIVFAMIPKPFVSKTNNYGTQNNIATNRSRDKE